jgi:uncharacterized glyoxalase superfamily protein PhnB
MEAKVTKNRSAPNSTIVPILVYDDVNQAIEWLCGVFGFTERLRAEHDGVTSHAQLAFAEGAIMLGRQGGAYRAPRGSEVSAYVLVTVDDVDKHHEHAKQCGADIVHPPTDMPFGERAYTARDPGGHWWTFSQHIADIEPEEWGAKTPDSH